MHIKQTKLFSQKRFDEGIITRHRQCSASEIAAWQKVQSGCEGQGLDVAIIFSFTTRVQFAAFENKLPTVREVFFVFFNNDQNFHQTVCYLNPTLVTLTDLVIVPNSAPESFKLSVKCTKFLHDQ